MANGVRKVTGPNKIQQLEHVDTADAKRVVDGGISIKLNSDGTVKVFADISSATEVGPDEQVLVTNPTSGTIFVKTGGSGVAAPTSANAIPIPPESQQVVAMLDDTHIRASAAAHALVLDD